MIVQPSFAIPISSTRKVCAPVDRSKPNPSSFPQMTQGCTLHHRFLVAFVFKSLQNPFLATRVVSHLYKTTGVSPIALPKKFNRSLATSQLFCLYLLAASCSLFALFFAPASFIFSNLRTLFAKHRGWGSGPLSRLPCSPARYHFALLSPRCYHELYET